MKHCPFCAEEIQADAVKCKHCGEMIGNVDRTPFRFRPLGMTVAFLCIGPLMLPLVWWNPHLRRENKIVLTAVIVVVTALLGWATVGSIENIIEYYRTLNELGSF
jgi:predicted nucleic acid-binding Zn ribbon protein